MHYRSVGNRCAVCISDLKLPISEKEVLEILRQLGFSVLDINLVELAMECIGKSKYKLGASAQEAPTIVDCSSFTKWLFGQGGIWLPRLSIQQRREGRKVAKPNAGDLVFTVGHRNFYETDSTDEVGHVGIATSDDYVIHAAGKRAGVVKTPLHRFMCGKPRGIRRIIRPNMITLVCPTPYVIETSDDVRWLVLKHIT